MRADKAISLTLKCKQGDRVHASRIYLEDHQLAASGIFAHSQSDGVHPHDGATVDVTRAQITEGFRQWLQARIVGALDLS
jgi:hypothetical protein